jgi:hypothetical protein
MGLRCSKQRIRQLSDCRRDSPKVPAAHSPKISRVRLQALRNTPADGIHVTVYRDGFKEGFALGLKISVKEGFALGLKISDFANLLKRIDSGDSSGPELATREMSDAAQGSELGAHEPVQAVLADARVPEKVEDESPELVRQIEPHFKFDDLLKEDFKPWTTPWLDVRHG